MAQYAIILRGRESENTEVAQRIKEKYPECYPMSEEVYLVQAAEPASQIAVAVGLKGDERVDDVAGLVLKLNGAYSGYDETSLWHWLRDEK